MLYLHFNICEEFDKQQSCECILLTNSIKIDHIHVYKIQLQRHILFFRLYVISSVSSRSFLVLNRGSPNILVDY